MVVYQDSQPYVPEYINSINVYKKIVNVMSPAIEKEENDDQKEIEEQLKREYTR